MPYKIPFTKTTLGDEELGAIHSVIKSGWVAQGSKTEEFEEAFAKYVGADYAVFVDSGTAALFLSLQSMKYFFNEYVRVPSLTFTSTVEVVVNSGLKPYFNDIEKDLCSGDFDIAVNLTGVKAKDTGQLIYDSAHRIIRDDVKGSKA